MKRVMRQIYIYIYILHTSGRSLIGPTLAYFLNPIIIKDNFVLKYVKKSAHLISSTGTF